MITVDRYRALTGDTTSGDVEATDAITDATGLLEEFLDRPLTYGERTEAMRPDRTGRLWPKATPVATVDDGYTIDGLAVTSGSTFFPVPSFVGTVTSIEVTYTGGWADARLDEEDQEGPALPTCLQRDLASVAYRLLHPTITTAAGIVPGANSVRLGDAAVSGPRLDAGDNTDAWWSRRTRGYRWTGPLGVAV